MLLVRFDITMNEIKNSDCINPAVDIKLKNTLNILKYILS